MDVRIPAPEENYYATEEIQTQNTASNEDESSDTDDVSDIEDFLYCNILASIFCCQLIGLLGLLFSKMCESAKAKGDRKEAKCYSITAGILFASSIVSTILVIALLNG